MAARDIMPWRSAGGGPGSTVKVETYHLHPNQTFGEGEVVVLTEANGQLAEAAHNPDVGNHTDAANAGAIGISAEPAAGMASDAAGTTNAEWSDRGVWIFTTDQEWITRNYTDDEDGNAWTRDAIHADIGDEVGLCLNTSGAANEWGISENADTTHKQFRITDVLDANKQSIKDATTEATWVVFRLQSAHYPAVVQ
jgi:hypothetical protein